MRFNEARDALAEGYSSLGLEVSLGEKGKSLLLKNSNNEFRVLEDDIAQYAVDSELFDSFETLPAECSICSTDIREQRIDYIGSYRYRYSAWMVRDDFTFGDRMGDVPFATITKASHLFLNYFRFNATFVQLSLRRMQGRHHLLQDRDSEKLDVRHYMYNPMTIRVENLQARSIELALRTSSAVIDGCLFELSYLQDLPLGLMEEWPKSTAHEFRLQKRRHERDLPIPSVRFDPNVVKLYQRGMSADDPVTQFLSFYQVLEYFFIAVTDEELYARLSSRINDPAFSTTARKLDGLIQEVVDHGRTTDETEMLKAVLRRYVSAADLIDFIRQYEAFLGEKAYTKRKKLFGSDMVEVRLEEPHVFGNIAKRIKVFRNALVHSSDCYDRNERFVPLTSAHERIVRREVPLLRFLAERIVIATSHT